MTNGSSGHVRTLVLRFWLPLVVQPDVCDCAGEVYRGQLLEAEDNMNCYIGSVTMTARDGRTSKLEQVALRGSQVLATPTRIFNVEALFTCNQIYICGVT